MLDNTVSENQLTPHPTEAQVPCDPTISNCPPTDRPFRPSCPIEKLKLGHVKEQPGENIRRPGNGPISEAEAFSTDQSSAFYANTFSTVFPEYIQRLNMWE